MRSLILTVAVVLSAVTAAAQYHPSKGTVTQLGACALADPDGGPRIKTVTDGADAGDCATGGGSNVHIAWFLCHGGCDGKVCDTPRATVYCAGSRCVANEGAIWSITTMSALISWHPSAWRSM
jgi:hypothetical protein